jgi:acyl dehydratase
VEVASAGVTTVDPTSVPRLAKGLNWEDTPAGFSFRTAARTVTESDLMSFVTLFLFTEPLFLDARDAAEGVYTGKGRLVPGAMTFALAEGLVMQTNAIHGTGMAFLHSELDVRKPVYVGDTLEVVVEITESRGSSRPGTGIVTAHNTVFNQDGDVVIEYTPVRMIKGRDNPAVDA